MKRGALKVKGKRYRLWRIWAKDRPLVLFLLLNPSTGDATQNDPTIKRLIFFAQSQGYGGFYLGNLYAHITPYPKELSQFNLNTERKTNIIFKICFCFARMLSLLGGITDSSPSGCQLLLKIPFALDKIKTGAQSIRFI